MGILRRARSFLGTPELLTMYKAFICSLIEYCSLLWAGAPTSRISKLHTVETKAFRIIGISCDEAESLGLSLSYRRQIGGLSVFYHFLSGLAPLPALLEICPPPPHLRSLAWMPQIPGALPHFKRFTAACVSTNEGGSKLIGGSTIGIVRLLTSNSTAGGSAW